ncbi:MAG: hypothetical protein DI635_01480 [Pseudoxanthomonas suwonensis]|nr:MAG: hypothetical protein DI635_01480 [Pseudoxanthomonas suwonensis]
MSVSGLLVCAQASAQCGMGIPSAGNPNCIPPDILHGQGNVRSRQTAPPQYSPQIYYPPITEWLHSHNSVVTHENADETWVATGFASQDEAEQAAIASCTETMGKGCHTLYKGSNLCASVGRDEYNSLWVGHGEDLSEAEDAMMRGCRREGRICEEITAVWGSAVPKSYSVPEMISRIDKPDPDSIGIRFAAVAYATGDVDDSWARTIWIQGGFMDAATAEAKVKERCERDTGGACRIHRSVTGISLLIGRTNDEISVLNTPGPKSASAVQTRYCGKKPAGSPCEPTLLYPSRRQDLVVHHVDRAPVLELRDGDLPPLVIPVMTDKARD